MAQTSMADTLVRRSISGVWADKPMTTNTAATGSVYTDDWMGRLNKNFGKSKVGHPWCTPVTDGPSSSRVITDYVCTYVNTLIARGDIVFNRRHVRMHDHVGKHFLPARSLASTSTLRVATRF